MKNMNGRFDFLHKKILASCSQGVIIEEANDIKNHFDLRDETTLRNINDLTNWLYVIDEKELALESASLIDYIEFEGDFLIWENVQSVLVIKSFIYKGKCDIDKSNSCILTITNARNTGDEATIRKRQRILQRVLNGSLLHDKEILEAQQTKDIQSEIKHRFLQFKRLSYMRVMGGSELYPVEYLDKGIIEQKEFLKEKSTIANFKC
jgi:hypothetical protein